MSAKYGDDQAQNIIGNCSNIAYLYSREMPLLKMISELCGERYLSDGRQIPLITTSQLQRLDKDKGEVLLLCGRNFPYITNLPDIDEFKCFKGYPISVTSETDIKQTKIMSVKKVLYEIEIGKRPVPFTIPKQTNEGHSRKLKVYG